MNLTSFLQDKHLTVALRGEIDHHSAKDIMRVLGNKIDLYLPRVCVLDFREVTFMDSSGIAIVISCVRRMRQLRGEVILRSVPPQPMKVLKASGMKKGALFMKAENEMTLTFPSRSSNESFARAAVACFAAQLDPNLEELNDIKTAVSEAVTNCIVHAYRDCLGTVTIRCRILPESVLDIVIRDKGCGMEDVEKARAPMFTTGGPERSGMGFTIMESFMTSLQVTSKPGKGTTVHMKRKIVQRRKTA